MRLKPWQEAVFLLVLVAAVLALGYGPDRSNTNWLLAGSGVACLSYFFIANAAIAWKRTFVVALLVRLILLFAPVGWTDDHFRYVFDGGISHFELDEVYDITPEEASAGHNILGNEFVPLVNHSETYTVYPPFAQLIFANAYALGSGQQLNDQGASDIGGVITWMRVFILLMEILTLAAIVHLLRAFLLPESWVAWYALNPLVIMEFSVNLHTEVYMITWSLLAALAIKKGHWGISAILLGVAAAAKLWPIMFLAFLPAWVGWGRGVKYGLVTVATFIIFWIPFYTESLLDNVSESLNLYISYFEFNESIYYVLKALLPEGWVKGSSLMGGITILAIISLGLFAWKRKWKSVAEGMLWIMAIYFAFASTVHPWYIIPLLAFGSVTHYRWPFIWSALIIPTYLTYGQEPYQQPFWWVWIEYLLLIGVIALELMVHSTWAMKRRAAIKFAHLKELVPARAKVLDVGTGNGSLARELAAHGLDMTTVDIVNKSRFETSTPVLIDGQSLPFEDDAFDVVMVITVLHHTTTQLELLTEAKRVGKQVIVMEDVYNSNFQKYLTYLFDSLINLEFWGHPHSNRDDTGWESVFEELGLHIRGKRHLKTMGLFDQVIYSLSS